MLYSLPPPPKKAVVIYPQGGRFVACEQALWTLSLLSPHDFFTLSPNREPAHRLAVLERFNCSY